MDHRSGIRLLIVTQTVDIADPVLGFFHGWLREFSKRYEKISVVCLKQGEHHLPVNVQVYSLGKEQQASKLNYVLNFYRHVWKLRREYDTVLVHMNQEYVLLGGLLWKLLGKKVFLWRNHYSGSLLTDIAAALCTKVFCTSRFSYTAKYKKTILMPVGIDTGTWKPIERVERKGSILSLGRIAPSKRLEILIEAVGILKQKGITIQTNIYGDALPVDASYRDSIIRNVQEKKLERVVHFHPGIPNIGTPGVYSAHELFVNCSHSGMYDKTIFEAAACEALAVASSRDYADITDPRLVFDGTPQDLAGRIEVLFALPPQEKDALRQKARASVEDNSLSKLAQVLAYELAQQRLN
ncbi:hypothetical protein A3H16_04255 [Candidatus Kaiserbacteria bacterium RIFCSPLOWO2_12_FULL_53_8]|uniref:Glycosyl transferase family 1 domain-containing protein n=2 Tax=Candidatus Kaiseribacteriota TaxID=1752734 RepID=A0A1F6CY23_9BACT|nr:MAG: hypothetical protein A2851_02500 [Candidatus Kaiserbacteria bacterium RIFCSPHIGHO2_01_FULL_53_29]OGG91109.1 MAG: hypothetical protein A3H16_04255 [Candidatus Kaiserbacteria bacterium RIFCSPLOWO2_12_FULL_53_8]